MSDDSRYDALEIVKAGFEGMVQEEVVIAPWLAMNTEKSRVSSELMERLKAFSKDLALTHREAYVLWLESIDTTPAFREQAYYETLLSTAAYLSYMRLGTLVITDEMVSVSHSLLRKYLADHGGSALLSVYARVSTYLNTQVLRYYQKVPESIFVSGKWHRPWIHYTLEHELESGILYGLFRQVHEKEETFIELTEQGKKLYQACRQDLEACGYLRQREQLMRAANFTNMDDYEKIMEHSLVGVHDIRKSLIQWSEIKPGMRVLELGCGAGGLTLDDGLYEVIGNHGQLIATDPSIGMLERAKRKLVHRPAPNVKFRQAQAENIPYPDNTFDAVIGMLFLHFTDLPKALEEIRRVTRPGGSFTTVYVLDFIKKEAFFTEWFEPIFKAGLAAKGMKTLPQEFDIPNTASRYFEDFTFETVAWELDWSRVEDIVKFLIQAGTMVELGELPWQARNALFEDLIERGHDVKKKYGPSSIRRRQHGQWFKATITKE